MGNALGNIFNRKAHDLTAKIENATNVAGQDALGDIRGAAIEDMSRAASNRGDTASVNGHMVSDVIEADSGDLSDSGDADFNETVVISDDGQEETVITSDSEREEVIVASDSEQTAVVAPERLVQAERELTVAEQRVEGLRGYEDEVSPEVEQAEVAHEQDLARIEAISTSGNEVPTDGEDVATQYDQMVAKKFVKSERAIAEGTMAAVDRVVSGAQDVKLADILALYEGSANAMHEMDEGVA